MDFFFYILFSALYMMVIHFALAIKKEFNLWLMGGFFVLGGVIGWFLHTYTTGFVIAVILSLLFW